MHYQNKFRIGYDLVGPGRPYEALFKAAAGLGDAVWGLKSEIWLATNRSMGDVDSTLARVLDGNDKYMLGEYGQNFRFRNISPDGIAWMKRNGYVLSNAA